MLYAWLCKCVVVLNAIQQLRETPEAVGFQLLTTGLGYICHAALRNVASYRHGSHTQFLIKLNEITSYIFTLQCSKEVTENYQKISNYTYNFNVKIFLGEMSAPLVATSVLHVPKLCQNNLEYICCMQELIASCIKHFQNTHIVCQHFY